MFSDVRSFPFGIYFMNIRTNGKRCIGWKWKVYMTEQEY